MDFEWNLFYRNKSQAESRTTTIMPWTSFCLLLTFRIIGSPIFLWLWVAKWMTTNILTSYHPLSALVYGASLLLLPKTTCTMRWASVFMISHVASVKYWMKLFVIVLGRVQVVSSDNTRHFTNWCGICKWFTRTSQTIAKPSQIHSHKSILLLELY